jgi:hypothetical protein
MQTGSSGTLIDWKSGQTTDVPIWDRMEGSWLWTLVIKTAGGSGEMQWLRAAKNGSWEVAGTAAPTSQRLLQV